MRANYRVRSIGVPMLAPALGEHEFLLRPQHRELSNVLEIVGKSSFSGRERYSCELQGHWSTSIEETSRASTMIEEAEFLHPTQVRIDYRNGSGCPYLGIGRSIRAPQKTARLNNLEQPGTSRRHPRPT